MSKSLSGGCDRVDEPVQPDGAQREEMVYDKEKLLSVYDATKTGPPRSATWEGRYELVRN